MPWTALIAALLMGAAGFAAPTEPPLRSYPLPSGQIHYEIPADWKVFHDTPHEATSETEIMIPAEGNAFRVQITGNCWSDATREWLLRHARKDLIDQGHEVLRMASSGPLEIKPLPNNGHPGWFFTLPHRDPAPESFPWLTRVAVVFEDCVANGAIYTRDATAPEIGIALRMLAGAARTDRKREGPAPGSGLTLENGRLIAGRSLYSLTIPEGWSLAPGSTAREAWLRLGESAFRLRIEVAEAEGDLKTHFDARKAEATFSWGIGKWLGDERLKIGKQPARAARLSLHTVERGEELHHMFVVVKDGIGFALTWKIPMSQEKTLEPILRGLLESIHFGPEPAR